LDRDTAVHEGGIRRFCSRRDVRQRSSIRSNVRRGLLTGARVDEGAAGEPKQAYYAIQDGRLVVGGEALDVLIIRYALGLWIRRPSYGGASSKSGQRRMTVLQA
jgi:hypothetical protein